MQGTRAERKAVEVYAEQAGENAEGTIGVD